MSEKKYSLTLPSDPERLPEVEKFFIRIAREHNLEDEDRIRLALSVSEAASNGMIHGNKRDRSKKVFIKVVVSESKAVVTVRDEGEGFDPEDIPDPTIPENILKDNGRGIFIMRSYLDDLKYNFTPEGTETILTLNIK